MRIISSVIAFLLVALFLTGCDSDNEDKTSTAPVSDTMTDTEIFLKVVHDRAPELKGVPDSNLTNLGNSLCDLLDAGGTVEDFFDITLSSGLSPNVSGTIAGAGVAAFCPKYGYLFE